MNSNHDLPGRPDLEGRLRRHLDASAASVGSPGLDLDGIRHRGRRRRTAVRSAVATTSVVALVAVGFVALRVTGGDGDEGFAVDGGTPVADSVADDTAPTDPSSRATSDPDAETGNWTTVAPGPSPAPTTLIDIAGASQSVTVDASGAMVAAWNGGFVRIETRWEAPPIGPLTDDVIALFPPEVVEFFTDRLPATTDEGLAMLSDRPDLLAEVQRVIAEHPEAYDAIMGGRSSSTLLVDTSNDGVTWERVGELPPPGGAENFTYVRSAGDRLVVVGDAWDDVDSMQMTSRTIVASTLDLRTWDTVQELDDGVAEETTPGVRRQTYVSSFDATASGVAVSLTDSLEFVIEELVPAEVRAELEQSLGGYGTSTGPDGVTVEIYGQHEEVTAPGMDGTEIVDWSEGEVLATYSYTWDELGIDPDLAMNPSSGHSIWTGDVAAGLVRAVVPDLDRDAWVLGTVTGPDGVVWAVTTDRGPKVFHSADGVTWADRTPSLGAAYVQHLGRTADGILLFADGVDGAEVWIADGAAQGWERGDASLLAIEGLGRGYAMQTSGDDSGYAAVFSYDGVGSEPTTGEVVLERDGYRLTQTISDGPPSIELVRLGVDGAPDEVVFEIDAAVDLSEVMTVNDDGSLSYSDPATGELLVTFTSDDMDAAYVEAFGEPEMSMGDSWLPTFVLAVTEDGRSWRVLDRIDPPELVNGDPIPGTERWPSSLVITPDRVLFGLDGGPEGAEYRLYDR